MYDILNPAAYGEIFDTHAHYDDKRFDGILDSLLKEMHTSFGVSGIINCASDTASAKTSLELANKYDFIYAAVGVHPECVTKQAVDISALKELAENKRVVAIGEIGLDYYWHPEMKEEQIRDFCLQIELAQSLDLPIIVHDREAHEDTIKILKRYHPKGVLHCFSGSVETAVQIIKMGMYIGIGGVVTFKNSKKLPDVIKSVPLNKILLETDAPYMAPEPFRGKTNNSALICYVAQKIADIKGITRKEVFDITKQNAYDLFLTSK